MKSLIAILIVMAVAVALSGCCSNPCNPCGPIQVAPVYQSPCCPAPGGGIG